MQNIRGRRGRLILSSALPVWARARDTRTHKKNRASGSAAIPSNCVRNNEQLSEDRTWGNPPLAYDGASDAGVGSKPSVPFGCGLASDLKDAGAAPSNSAGALGLDAGLVAAIGSAARGTGLLQSLTKASPIAGYFGTATSAVSAAVDFANENYADFAFEGVNTAVGAFLSSLGPQGAAAAAVYQVAGGSKFLTERVATGLCHANGGA